MCFETDVLQLAVKNLYRVFRRYTLRDHIPGCECCVTEWDQQRLQVKPLDELTASDLAKYAAKAVSSWGTITDFKHFLPRLLELLTEDANSPDQGINPPVLLEKLRHAQYAQWPERERHAVETFLRAWWQAALDTYPAALTAETCLVSIAQIVTDIDPYLASWQQSRSIPAMRHLAEFVFAVADDLQERGTITGPFWSYPEAPRFRVIEWLGEFRTINALENAFFIYNFEGFTADFSRAAERLIAIKDGRRAVAAPEEPSARELLRKFRSEIRYHSSMADSVHSSISESIH